MNLTNLVKGYEHSPPPKERVEKPFTVWPSEASCLNSKGKVIGKCLRQMYYEWKCVTPSGKISDHLIQTIIWGEAIEAYLIKRFKAMGILVGSKESYKFKFDLNGNIRVSGRLDGMIKHENQTPAIEIKTYEGEPKYILHHPKEPHLMQAFLYLCLYRPKLPYIIVYYRQRPGHRFAQTKDICHRIDYVKIDNDAFPVINGQTFKEISFRKIASRWKKAKYYITNNILPPNDFSARSKGPCSWCLYKNECASNMKGKNNGKNT